MCMKEFKKDNLTCKVFPTRDEMGKAAAKDAAATIRKLLETQEEINMVFAAAPSQNDVLKHLLTEDVEWNRINAFHMDEYIGLPAADSRRFGNFLAEHIFLRNANVVFQVEIIEVAARGH